MTEKCYSFDRELFVKDFGEMLDDALTEYDEDQLLDMVYYEADCTPLTIGTIIDSNFIDSMVDDIQCKVDDLIGSDESEVFEFNFAAKCDLRTILLQWAERHLEGSVKNYFTVGKSVEKRFTKDDF